jgi:hypothetical protein
VFTWIMASLVHRMFTHPRTLWHGNAFYPHGESLAYSEPLLIPALLGLPGFLAGDPILTYNLLLLLLWPLNGLAMAWVAHALTGSRPAAFLAGAVFGLSPYFTEYYLEFQMLLACLFPIVLFAWIRWLETGARRWLALVSGGLVVQGMTTWYYTIILGLALVTLAVAFLCLRWRGWAWRRRLLWLGLSTLAVAGLLGPVALPYLQIHREFGYQRGIAETAVHYADVFSFFGGGRRTVADRYVPPIGRKFYPETSAFAGMATLGLAAVSLACLGRDGRGSAFAVWVGRIAIGGLAGSLLLVAWSWASGAGGPGLGPFRLPVHADWWLKLACVLGLVLLLLRGWRVFRERGSRVLTPGDWVRCLLFLTGVSALLALGPVIHVGGRDTGPGPYRELYDLVFPLHVIRVTIRFAVVSLAGLALLAALGLRVIQDRLAGLPGVRRAVVAVIFVALGFDYAATPAVYEPVSAEPRAVDRVLRADPDDVAVFEWPTNTRAADADALFRSLHHRKPLVNGLSGFVPPLIPELSDLWSRLAEPFPAPEAQAALRRIYPLRHLVIRLEEPSLPPYWRLRWLALRQAPPPLLHFVGSFGADDLYRIVPLPEHGLRFERAVSYDLLRARPILRLALQPRPIREDLDQYVEVYLNDAGPVGRVHAREGTTSQLRLPPPPFRAVPNVITLVHGYGRPPHARDAAYQIGTTGVLAPGDLVLVSRGGDLADRAGTVRFNEVELAPNRRGYNLVALNPTGGLIAAAAFDTFGRSAANGELAAWVAALPPGTVVAGAVKDEASGLLDDAAVRALRALGTAVDLRGHFREAHAFVGVKGAPPGSALERVGRPAVSLVVGRPDPERGVELTAFDLIPPDSRN